MDDRGYPLSELPNRRLRKLAGLDRAGVPVSYASMIAYFALFGCALAGYAGLAPYAIAACAIALVSLSYAEHGGLYRRGLEIGHARVVDLVMLKSLLNALVASTAAYGGGWVLRLV